MIYHLPKLRFEIIKPGTPLGRWFESQKVKPYLLMNASLYEGKRPIGTIIESGTLVSNAGNGFGFGVMPDGNAGFGDPWRGWRDYISGYYGIVQNGKAVARPFDDQVVFDQKRPRIAIAEGPDGLCVVTHDSADIERFAAYCAAGGLTNVANLDGGGSRFLILDGKHIFDSSRTPYNAIAGYL